MLPSRETCFNALKACGSISDASKSLGISRHQFRRITKNLNSKTFSYEEYRDLYVIVKGFHVGNDLQHDDDFRDIRLSMGQHE